MTATRASVAATGCAAGLLGLLVWFGYGHQPSAPDPAATPSPRPTPAATATPSSAAAANPAPAHAPFTTSPDRTVARVAAPYAP